LKSESVSGFITESRPASFRNADRDEIGIVTGIPRNPHQLPRLEAIPRTLLATIWKSISPLLPSGYSGGTGASRCAAALPRTPAGSGAFFREQHYRACFTSRPPSPIVVGLEALQATNSPLRQCPTPPQVPQVGNHAQPQPHLVRLEGHSAASSRLSRTDSRGGIFQKVHCSIDLAGVIRTREPRSNISTPVMIVRGRRTKPHRHIVKQRLSVDWLRDQFRSQQRADFRGERKWSAGPFCLR
jgi:hypothetical protein